jgi:hypothetical protein
MLGKGKRLFADDGKPSAFKVTHSRVSPTGLISATYVPDGEVKLGSLAQDTPSKAEVARREKLKREG